VLEVYNPIGKIGVQKACCKFGVKIGALFTQIYVLSQPINSGNYGFEARYKKLEVATKNSSNFAFQIRD
jgi:hypothetical protein